MSNTTWILIANGTQARIVSYTGPGKGLTHLDDVDFGKTPKQAKDIDTDASGSSGGSDHKPSEQSEADFIKAVADKLDAKAKAGVFDRLIIAAAPIALGNLRKSLSDHVKKTIIAELDKDLTNIPTGQLAKHFDGIVSA